MHSENMTVNLKRHWESSFSWCFTFFVVVVNLKFTIYLLYLLYIYIYLFSHKIKGYPSTIFQKIYAVIIPW